MRKSFIHTPHQFAPAGADRVAPFCLVASGVVAAVLVAFHVFFT